MQMFSGADYLRIDIANAFGFDKYTWKERLDWFEVMEDKLLKNPQTMVMTAKEPAQAWAGIQAYKNFLAQEDSGYQCGLDATASGIQLLAVLSGCYKTALTCNLVDTGKREDAYTRAYEEMCSRMETSGTVLRDEVKRALMTGFYGSKAVPREVFGEDTKELSMFYEVAGDLMPGAMQLNEDLQNLWNPETLAHSWVMPDGFDVHIKVLGEEVHQVSFLGVLHDVKVKKVMPQESSRSLSANVVHSVDGYVVREMGRRCNYDVIKNERVWDLLYMSDYNEFGKSTAREQDLALLRILELWEQSGVRSAVIFEYLDELNMGHLNPGMVRDLKDLLGSLPAAPFPIVSIHDAFKFPPNYGNQLRKQYNNILAELAESNLLSHLATQISGRTIKVQKLSHDLGQYIRTADYALS